MLRMRLGCFSTPTEPSMIHRKLGTVAPPPPVEPNLEGWKISQRTAAAAAVKAHAAAFRAQLSTSEWRHPQLPPRRQLRRAAVEAKHTPHLAAGPAAPRCVVIHVQLPQ